jgi:hypothetical protein
MNLRSSLLVATALLLSSASFAAESSTPRAASTGGKSPHETTSAVIGDRRTGNRVTITYGRPYTKDPSTGNARKIWGGLVAWDKPDRLGSDEATLLITQQPIVFGSTTIPAGAYTLYIVPSEAGATKLAFSSNLGKWGVPVDEKHDVARVDLKKSTVDTPVNQLTIGVENDKETGGGVIKITWENTQYSAPFTVAPATR